MHLNSRYICFCTCLNCLKGCVVLYTVLLNDAELLISACWVLQSCYSRSSVWPLNVLCFTHQRGFDSMDPFIPLSVPNYSEKEFESCYLYYTERNWLQHPQSKWWNKVIWQYLFVILFSCLGFLVSIRSNRGREERAHLPEQQESNHVWQTLRLLIKPCFSQK